MQSYRNNFYFKALIKTLKIHRCLNDINLKENIKKFGVKNYGYFNLPHLIFSIMPIKFVTDLIDTYCDLIAHQYAKDIASYYIQKIKERNNLHINDINLTVKQLNRLLNKDDAMMYSFTKAIKNYQLKSWMEKAMHCSNKYLEDEEFYDLIYGNKC
jgi:hypothetical protein